MYACMCVCVFIKNINILHFALSIQMVNRYNLLSENITHCFQVSLSFLYIYVVVDHRVADSPEAGAGFLTVCTRRYAQHFDTVEPLAPGSWWPLL